MMTDYDINNTEAYYKAEKPSLFWETTVCRSLSDPGSAYARALNVPRSYGNILADFLLPRLGGDNIGALLEIGGGEGTLMEILAQRLNPSTIRMVDISASFSALQRERLSGRRGVGFVVSDALAWLKNEPGHFDLVVSNENVGDFQTVVFYDSEVVKRLSGAGDAGNPAVRAAALAGRYNLTLPEAGEVAVNIGALELVEALAGRARAVFLSEHSACAKSAPPYEFLQPVANGRPRRICLKDHDEFSINFDHVETVARACGFTVERVWMPEFLGVRSDAGARFAAAAECVGNEAVETLHEFLNHVKEYECVFLTAC